MTEHRAPVPSTTSVVETRLGAVEVERAGDGPPVLVVHGSPGGSDQGVVLGRFLARAGFEVIAPARPGYQGTPLEGRESIDAQADLHAALLEALAIDRAGVLAWSGGGPSAYRLAVRHPARVTALVTAAAVSGQIDIELPASEKVLLNTGVGNWIVRVMADHAPKATVQSLLKAEGDITKAELKELTAGALADDDQLDVALSVMRAGADHKHRGTGIDNDYAAFAAITSLELDRIAVPTLVINGDVDEDVPPAHSEFAASTIPGATHLVLARGTHVALWIHPEAQQAQRQAIEHLRST